MNINTEKNTVGYDHSLAVDSKGNVYVWGANASGQLGDGTTTNRTSPVLLTSISDVSSITGGTSYTIALKSEVDPTNLW